MGGLVEKSMYIHIYTCHMSIHIGFNRLMVVEHKGIYCTGDYITLNRITQGGLPY